MCSNLQTGVDCHVPVGPYSIFTCLVGLYMPSGVFITLAPLISYQEIEVKSDEQLVPGGTANIYLFGLK